VNHYQQAQSRFQSSFDEAVIVFDNAVEVLYLPKFKHCGMHWTPPGLDALLPLLTPFSTEPTTRSASKNMPPDCLKPIHDSAGKLRLDKWTRQEERGRVEGKDHEEVCHEDAKEKQDVVAGPTA